MIICTKCGKREDDDARYCRGCGHKLQSGFEPFRRKDSGLGKWRTEFRFWRKAGSSGRYGEAWILAIALLVLTIICMYSRFWLPIYIGAAAVAAFVLVRKF